MLAVTVWMVWLFSVLPGGFRHVSAATAVFIAGFAGIAVLNVLGVAVAVVLFETTAAEGRAFFVGLLVHPAAPPPAEEEEKQP